MAQKKSRPIRTRNGIPLTRDEYRQLKRQKEGRWICPSCCWP